MKDEQIKYMVDRFLFWKLPSDFSPDCGIHFDADAAKRLNPVNHRYEPVGTNLFTATQATDMVRFMVEGMSQTVGDALCDGLAAAESENDQFRLALLKIATMGYAGAPDIEMRRIAKTALGLL